MENRNTDIDDLSEKILQGMRIALKELVETSAKNDEELIIGDKDGNIMSVPAKDLLPSVEK
jgi:hypothetical protein